MMTLEMIMIFLFDLNLMDKMVIDDNLIKGHGGGADGHSISSSLGVGSFAPVRLLVKDDHHQEGGGEVEGGGGEGGEREGGGGEW